MNQVVQRQHRSLPLRLGEQLLCRHQLTQIPAMMLQPTPAYSLTQASGR